MRRNDREITDPQEIMALLKAACVCRIALHDEAYPYIVPMNYGVDEQVEGTVLYLHCALEGEKLRLMRKNPKVAFEVDLEHRLIPAEAACGYGFAYASVIGQGILSQVEGEEKRTGLLVLMRQVAPERAFTIEEEALAHVAVLRLTVHGMTAKRRKMPQ